MSDTERIEILEKRVAALEDHIKTLRSVPCASGTIQVNADSKQTLERMLERIPERSKLIPI